MALPVSGTITIADINAEFGLGNSLAAYRGAQWYTANGGSGTFSTNNLNFQQFYSKQPTPSGPRPLTVRVEFPASASIVLTGTIAGTNMAIAWGDGTNDTLVGTASKTHTYPVGTYDIQISGDVGFRFSSATSKYVKDVLQWGDVNYISMATMFQDGYGLTVLSATDVPNLSNVRTLSAMFSACTSFNSPLNNWDVSTITNMNQMLDDTFLFNQPLDAWNTANVTNMNFMFQRSESFNQPLNSWNTANVTTSSFMFSRTKAFNQPLDAWNTGNITNMNGMFEQTSVFNQDLSGWCVSKIPTKPSSFDSLAAAWTFPRPVWGTCPP